MYLCINNNHYLIRIVAYNLEFGVMLLDGCLGYLCHCDTIAIRVFLAAATMYCAQLKRNAALILACQFKYLTAYRYICFNITLQS